MYGFVLVVPGRAGPELKPVSHAMTEENRRVGNSFAGFPAIRDHYDKVPRASTTISTQGGSGTEAASQSGPPWWCFPLYYSALVSP